VQDWFAKQAAHYDESEGFMFDPAEIAKTVDVLVDLAGVGKALEFAIGTGRIGLPLAERGVEVHAIELSEPMVEQLRQKADGAAIPVTIGDMTTTRLDAAFRLVYLVFNTIDNLTTQEAQVACFENAARHLEPGGCFVVEVHVPELRRLPPGERFVVFHVGENHVGVDEYDVATQGLVSHHVTARGKSSMPFRYVWPAELDLMARLAGLRLRDRFEDWDRSPFTNESPKHVSVWEKPS
jgi:SAM-dependent methyltransferase